MNAEEEAPEEPHLRSEPHLLSPASPKPLHFPAPTNIPVLDKMMDVGFNQTEAHMQDPAMRNTEVRPGAWQDPDSQQDETSAQTSTFVTSGSDAPAPAQDHGLAGQTGSAQAEYTSTDSNQAIAIPTEDATLDLSADFSLDGFENAATNPPNTTQGQSSSDPNAPAAETQPVSDANLAQAFETPIEPSQNAALNRDVDIEALLGSLHTAPFSASLTATPIGVLDGFTSSTVPSATPNSFQPAPGAEQSPLSAAGLGAPPSGLPARPPPQEQPLIHPNYVHSQHIRDYHPHATNPAVQQHAPTNSAGGAADQSSRGFVPPVNPPTSTSSSTSVAPGQPSPYQPSPVSATLPQTPLGGAQQHPLPSLPLESRREQKLAAGEPVAAEDAPWTPEIQQKYDDFVQSERQYVSEGRWDQFPHGSRLFVGNLSSERVTKRDIFHVFHIYGALAQISIKQAYGFVQFLRAEDCMRAMTAEQGKQIRDKKIRE